MCHPLPVRCLPAVPGAAGGAAGVFGGRGGPEAAGGGRGRVCAAAGQQRQEEGRRQQRKEQRRLRRDCKERPEAASRPEALSLLAPAAPPLLTHIEMNHDDAPGIVCSESQNHFCGPRPRLIPCLPPLTVPQWRATFIPTFKSHPSPHDMCHCSVIAEMYTAHNEPGWLFAGGSTAHARRALHAFHLHH